MENSAKRSVPSMSTSMKFYGQKLSCSLTLCKTMLKYNHSEELTGPERKAKLVGFFGSHFLLLLFFITFNGGIFSKILSFMVKTKS